MYPSNKDVVSNVRFQYRKVVLGYCNESPLKNYSSVVESRNIPLFLKKCKKIHEKCSVSFRTMLDVVTDQIKCIH